MLALHLATSLLLVAGLALSFMTPALERSRFLHAFVLPAAMACSGGSGLWLIASSEAGVGVSCLRGALLLALLMLALQRRMVYARG